MDLGVHLPIVDFGGEPPDRPALLATVGAARDAGAMTIAANDHLLWSRPWLDGLTALATVAEHAGGMTLATTVALPVVRGPVALAKALSGLAVLAGGPVVAGLGPGSSPRDHAAAGLPFDERWPRFDAAVATVRSLLHGGPVPGTDLPIAPLPAVPPEVWIGSWGSPAGLRRVARLADGWLASAYNTTPAGFRAARAGLDDALRARGRDPATMPDGVATMWTFVTESRADAERVLRDRLAPAIGRDPDEVRDRVCVGGAAQCAELLAGYAEAGAGRMLLWPVADAAAQVRAIGERVWPAVAKAGATASGARRARR